MIISYYTKDPFYEKEAERLKQSCERFGLEYRIEGIEPFGKWHEHTCYKPQYILQKLHELRRPILWVDADAEIVQKPTLSFDCDLAARVYPAYPKDHPCYLFTGTLYVNYNQAALSLLQLWIEACQKGIQEGELTVDQPVLGKLLLSAKVCFQTLPDGYAAIFEEIFPKKELFITHYQASRLYRKIIDGELALGFLENLTIDQLRDLRPRVY